MSESAFGVDHGISKAFGGATSGGAKKPGGGFRMPGSFAPQQPKKPQLGASAVQPARPLAGGKDKKKTPLTGYSAWKTKQQGKV